MKVYAISVALLSAAALVHFARKPAGPATEPHLFAGSGQTCNLSVPDQVKAVDTFAEMMPVFRHPRCMNCHGEFDVTSDDHSGAAVAKSSGLDPRGFLTVQQRLTLHQDCGECHRDISGSATRMDGTTLSGWMLPPPPMLWAGKSDEELCKLVKGFEENADSFVSHVDIDHGEVQFVDAAFEGKRALSDDDLDTYGVKPEPPPGSKSGVVAIARRWTKLFGNDQASWKEPGCGCVKPKVELIMRGEIVGKTHGQAISGDFNGRIVLVPDTLLTYKGIGTVTLSNFRMPIPPQCSVVHNVPPGKVEVKELRFDPNGEDISLLIFPENMTGTHTLNCPGLPHPVSMPLVVPMQQWRYAHDRDRRGADHFFDDWNVQPQASSGRSLVGRKEVTRTVSTQGVDVTAKTIFEIWSVPPGQ